MQKQAEVNRWKFQVYPERARAEEDTLLTLCFEQPLSDNDSVSIRLESSGCDEQKWCPAERLNPYTYRFVLPEHEEGRVQIIILVNELAIGNQSVTYYSVESDVIRGVLQIYMFLIAQMGEFLKSRNLIIHELDAMLCDLMNDAEGQQISIHAFEHLFGVWRHETETCQTELPTLLHFVGKYGLGGLGAMLMDLPDSPYACRVKNSSGLRPGDLAIIHGHQKLAQMFQSFLLELDAREKDNGPVDEPEGSYDLERPVCGADSDYQRSASLKRLQKAPISHQVSRSESIYMTMQGTGNTKNRPHRSDSGKGIPSECQTASPYLSTSPPDYELPVVNGCIAAEHNNGPENFNDSEIEKLDEQGEKSSAPAVANKAQEFYPDHQIQLLNIMEKVKSKELTIDQAEELVREWKTRYPPSMEKSPCRALGLSQSSVDGGTDVKIETKSGTRLNVGLFSRSVSSIPSNEASSGKANKVYSSPLKKLRPKWTKSQQSLAIPEKENSTLPDVKQLFGISLDDSMSPRSSTTSSTSRESCTSYQSSTSGIESADESRRSNDTSKDTFSRTPSGSNGMKLFENRSIYELEEETNLKSLSPPPLPPRAIGPPARIMGPGQTFSLDRCYSKSQVNSGLSRSGSDVSGYRRSLEDEDLYGSFPGGKSDDDPYKYERKPTQNRKGSLPYILEMGQSTIQLDVTNADQSDDSTEEYIDMDQPMNTAAQSFDQVTSNTLPLLNQRRNTSNGDYKNLLQNSKFSLTVRESVDSSNVESPPSSDLYDSFSSVEKSKCPTEQERQPPKCLHKPNSNSVKYAVLSQNDYTLGDDITKQGNAEATEYLESLQIDFRQEMDTIFGLKNTSTTSEITSIHDIENNYAVESKNTVIYSEPVGRNTGDDKQTVKESDKNADIQRPSKSTVLPAKSNIPPAVRSKPLPPPPPSKKPILSQTTDDKLE